MSKFDARHSESANARMSESTNEVQHFRTAYGIATPAMTVPHFMHLPSRSARTRVW
jgi:hypothetical protein